MSGEVVTLFPTPPASKPKKGKKAKPAVVEAVAVEDAPAVVVPPAELPEITAPGPDCRDPRFDPEPGDTVVTEIAFSRFAEGAEWKFGSSHPIKAGGRRLIQVISTHQPGDFDPLVFFTQTWVTPTGEHLGKADMLRCLRLYSFRRAMAGAYVRADPLYVE